MMHLAFDPLDTVSIGPFEYVLLYHLALVFRSNFNIWSRWVTSCYFIFFFIRSFLFTHLSIIFFVCLYFLYLFHFQAIPCSSINFLIVNWRCDNHWILNTSEIWCMCMCVCARDAYVQVGESNEIYRTKLCARLNCVRYFITLFNVQILHSQATKKCGCLARPPIDIRYWSSFFLIHCVSFGWTCVNASALWHQCWT